MCGHNVVIACLPSGVYGLTSATSVAKDMLRSFNIRVGLMVGIGGGVPKHGVRLGDVVISQPSGQLGGVVQYDFGKSVAGGKFIRIGQLNSPPKALLASLSSLRSDVAMYGDQSQTHIKELARKFPAMASGYASPSLLYDVLFSSEDEHIGDGNCESSCYSNFMPLGHFQGYRAPVVHFGLIASGNQVMKDAKRRDEISNDNYEKVLCFDMEAAGLMNDFPCIVIRGICDYSDSHKNKEWQEYAAAIAAAQAKELLRFYATSEVLETPITVPGHFIVPFGRNHNFIGREAQLAELILKSDPKNNKHSCQRVALAGLGGVGKTQIALEAAFRIQEATPACSVFWVPAINQASFDSTYRDIGEALGIIGIDDDKADVKVLVQSALSKKSAGSWLMIIDNADNADMLFGAHQGLHSPSASCLADYLPSSYNGSILLTTRVFGIATQHAETEVMEIQEMSHTDAQHLLQRSLGTKASSDEEEDMKKLLRLLLNLPLAIKQAAAFMNKNKKSVSRYLETYMSSDIDLIEMLSQDFEDHGRYNRVLEQRNPVAITWWINFEHISHCEGLAKSCLCFMFCIAAQGIPRSLLPRASDREIEDAVSLLEQYAFITSYEGGKFYNIHRLVQLAGRNWLESRKELIPWSCKALEQITEMFPFFEHETRDVCTILLPHAQSIYNFPDFPEDMAITRANLAHNIGGYFHNTGQYSEAESTYSQAFELKRAAFGVTHPLTLVTMNQLADVYRGLGKYAEAENLQQETLELKEALLGTKHPLTLDSMDNLALVYEKQGKFLQAEALQLKTLELKSATLGTTHPSTLNSMNNLAIVYERQGKYLQAEALQLKTLELKRATLGPTHPFNLSSMGNLAIIYDQQGKYPQAEALQQETLKLRRATFGATHPSTLASMNNLALIYERQGKYPQAAALQQETLELTRATFGTTNPSTFDSMNNLALIYEQQGKYAKAESLYQEALELRREVLGTHPSMLDSINNLALVCTKQGKYAKVASLYQEAIELRRVVLRNQGKHAEAEAFDQKVLEIEQQILNRL